MASGTENGKAQFEAAEALQHHQLIQLLDRQTSVQALDALVAALRPTPNDVALERTAIGLDANVFLRLGNHAKGEDIVDYLSARHAAPLILPGQAIQEFWNNQLHAVDTVSSGLKKRFDVLKADFGKVDKNFGDYASQIEALLDQFSIDHGHVYEEGTVRKTLNLLEMLQKRVHQTEHQVLLAALHRVIEGDEG